MFSIFIVVVVACGNIIDLEHKDLIDRKIQSRIVSFSTQSMATAIIYRTSSIEHGLHLNTGDSAIPFQNSTHNPRLPSPLPPAPAFLKDISRTSSNSTQGSNSVMFTQPNFHTRSASLSVGKAEEYRQQQQQQQHQQAIGLPGLTALASVASTKEPHSRY